MAAEALGHFPAQIIIAEVMRRLDDAVSFGTVMRESTGEDTGESVELSAKAIVYTLCHFFQSHRVMGSDFETLSSSEFKQWVFKMK